MESMAAEITGNRCYEVFEPYCKWNTQEGQEIIDIDLKGFRKEQLKVQTNNKGILIIQGERPLDKATKWSRFQKEIKLTKDCNPNEIRAKFSHGILSIIIPKIPKQEPKSTKQEANNDHNAVWGLKITKRRIFRVAVVVVAVVAVVAIGTQIARLVHARTHPISPLQENDYESCSGCSDGCYGHCS